MNADQRFEVDWCPELKFDTEGNHDMDGEARRSEYFATFAEAVERGLI